jgi:hypothetical protein
MPAETPPPSPALRRDRPRFARAIALATLAHVPLLLLARRPPTLADPVPPSAAAAISISISISILDIEPLAPEVQRPSARSLGPAERSTPERPDPTGPPPSSISIPRAHRGAAAPDAADVSAKAPAPTGARSEYDPLPDEGPSGGLTPGLGGPPLWSLPGAVTPPAATPASTAPPALRPVNEDAAGAAVREGMAANDRAHGVDPTGARDLASAIAEAARGPEAPRIGRATFDVRVDKNGHAAGLSLQSAASGDARAWEVVAKKAAASLRGRTFPLGPSFARGARVSVDVIAAMELPSGPTRWITPRRLLDEEQKPLPKPRSPDDVSSAGDLVQRPEKIFQLRIVDFDVTNFGAGERHTVRSSFRVTPVY